MFTSNRLTKGASGVIIVYGLAARKRFRAIFYPKVNKKVHTHFTAVEIAAFRQNNTISTENSTKIFLFVRFSRFPYKKRYSSRLQRFMCFQPFSYGFTRLRKNKDVKCIKKCILHRMASKKAGTDADLENLHGKHHMAYDTNYRYFSDGRKYPIDHRQAPR